MLLKELVIKNFKSFNYIKIPFDKGLHVIVGPNGSGKSNIVDALLFAFGITSLKRLRVDRLSNLINHHTKASTALVRVILKNNDEEIELSREIDKEGKSIFSLNGKKQALHEILSYLNDLGFDTEGFNTVQQGDVTKIINLNSEERRTIIDDISGISLFDARKKEAEINLKKVKERLDKVTIALNERKPYVEQLREEKENAIKFNSLDKQEKSLSYNLYKNQITELEKEISDYEKELEDLDTTLNLIISQKQNDHQEIKNLEQKLELINQDLISHSEKVQTTIGKQLSELSANKEILFNTLNSSKNSLDFLNSENQKSSKELSEFLKSSDELKIIISNLHEKIKEKKTEKDALKSKLDISKKDFEKVKLLQEELYNDLSSQNNLLSQKQNLFFEKKSRLNAFSLQLENIEKQNQESNEKIKIYKEKIKKLSEESSFFEKEISKFQKDLDKLKQDILLKTKEKENLLDEINSLVLEISFLKKELSNSANISNKRKEIKSSLSCFSSFVGFLDDLVSLNEVEKSYYISYIVLEDDTHLKKIISKIDYNLSFVVLKALNLKKNELNNFFKNKLNIKNPKISLQDYYFDGFSFKKIFFKDTTKLEANILSKENNLSSKNSYLEDLTKKILNQTNTQDSLIENIVSLNLSLNTKQTIKNDLLEKLNQESENQKNKSILTRYKQEISSLEKEISVLEQEIKIGNSRKQEIEFKLKKFNISINDSLRNEYDEQISELNLLEQAVISKDSDFKIFQEKILNKKEYIEFNNKKIKTLKEEINSQEDKKNEIENKILKVSKTYEQEDNKKAKLYEDKQNVSTKLNFLSQNVLSQDSKISNLNLSVNNIKIMLSTNQSKIYQIEQNLKFMEIEKADMVLDHSLSFEEISSELRRVKREKNSLGNINFNAITNYDKLAKEYDEILDKSNILLKEKTEVENMLLEINVKKKTVFLDCFNKINKEFKNIIKQMSKLLSGELVLEGENPLESKLLINITKNNKTKDIDIMSGGEKSITALAFIFSLHAYRKAPFYILDEVDASLDDYNSKNLLNYVKNLLEENKEMCVLSVSHNPVFVSGANQIIGVSLKEHSSVIGLNLK